MASAAIDPYDVLGVAKTATPEQIRSAYRALAARYHPDKHAGNPLEGLAAEKLAEINRAYAMLSDRGRRPDPAPGAGPVVDAQWRRAAAAKNRSLTKLIVLVLALPLLLKFGGGLLRLLASLLRGSAGSLRGLPVLGLVALVLVFGSGLLLRRRGKSGPR